MNEDALKRQGFMDDDTIDNYLMNQTQGLCNLVDHENFRAVLCNDTLAFSDISWSFWWNAQRQNNGQAVFILLKMGDVK